MSKKHTVAQLITVDRVQRFNSQIIVGIIASILISVVMAGMLLEVTPPSKVAWWLSAFLVTSLIRLSVYSYYRRRGTTIESVGMQKNLLLLSLFFAGCMWGTAAIFLFPYNSITHQVLLAFVLGGMVAGSVNIFASIMTSFYVFSIPTIVPLTVVLFSIGDRLHMAMGLMLAIFVLFMALANRKINLEIYAFLLRKHQNLELIRNLEQEIGVRQAAEEKLLLKNQQIESIVEERTVELRQVNEQLLAEIDERIEAEKALKESELKYRELANSLPQIIFETDAGGRITFANRNAGELLGYAETDFRQGLSAFDVLAASQTAQPAAGLHAVLQGRPLTGEEYQAHGKDGRSFPVSVHAAPVSQHGAIVGVRGLIIDLTEQKRIEAEQHRLQNQLQAVQKMEVLGAVAGGVAHDLNNILSAIVSYPDLLLMQIPPDSSLRQPLLIMQESGKRAAAVVQDLLTLTRRGVVVEEVLNLNELIERYLQSPEHERLMQAHPGVRVRVALEAQLLNMTGSKVHLLKTVMNLVFNAAEAMPDGGLIDVATGNCRLDRPLRKYDAVVPGEYVTLTVADTGTGIAPEDIDRIFEPFFTRKKMGRSGTGLGMAVVWGAVEDHGGYIDVTSVEHQGTRFALYFPATRRETDGDEQPAPIAAWQGKGESILVVDDVPVQRRIASDLLTHLGYQVATAQSGEEAVELLRARPVDLVVLDMIMAPGMDGLDAFRQIRRMYPGQRAVIASGYSETERVREALALGAGPYVKKPYTWITLGQAVKTALNGAETTPQAFGPAGEA
jgi:PAS domain S-box-containing protein